jgi:DNA-binding transcriptional MerR regulator
MVESAERGGSERPARRGAPIPRKLFKIGELMAHTGVSRQTLHNYTMLGLITEEMRTESGHRLYGEEVFERLARIDELKRRHSLKEVREILEREPGR